MTVSQKSTSGYKELESSWHSIAQDAQKQHHLVFFPEPSLVLSLSSSGFTNTFIAIWVITPGPATVRDTGSNLTACHQRCVHCYHDNSFLVSLILFEQVLPDLELAEKITPAHSQVVSLAEEMNINPAAALLEKFRRDGGDDTELVLKEEEAKK